jgi:cytidylate kinase
VPDAQVKVFLTASATERARRRRLDLERQGVEASLEAIREEQARRDLQDSSRADSPLQVARGSVVVDTSRLSPEEVVERIVAELPATARAALDTPARTP